MLRILAIIVTFQLWVGIAAAERRLALVIGIDDYEAVRKLDNAVEDAEAVEETLELLGFQVSLEKNRDLKRLRRSLDDFREDAAGADVALVFYAGHGVEISGDNRLLPADADASSLETLKASTLPLEEVRTVVADASKVGLIILDACRNDPFGVSMGDGSGRGAVAIAPGNDVKPGLGRVGRAEGILFAFSAAPGETASDGADGHSPFAAALARYLGTEGIEIRSALTLVQQEVYDRSRGMQLPYVENGLPRLFFAAKVDAPLPERERLLLAMAELTPELRAEVEVVATGKDVPLAPLYGALIAADLAKLSPADRADRLAEVAGAYAETRDRLKTLASSDPDVTHLRGQAEESLELGALVKAESYLDQAIAIDRKSRKALREGYVQRTLSEAASLDAKAGVARTGLRHAEAVEALEMAAALHAELEPLELPDSARSERNWLLAALGDLQMKIGDTEKALEAYGRMRAAAGIRLARTPGEPDAERDLSLSHTRVGDVLRAQGDLPGALAAYEDGLAIAERLFAADPDDEEWQRDLSVSYERIGNVQVAHGNLAGALAVYQAALAIRERLATADPTAVERQRDVSISLNKIGDVQVGLGESDKALAAFEAGLAIRKRLVAGEPGNSDWQRDLSVSHNRIGDVQFGQGKLAKARGAYEAALAIAERLAAVDPGNSQLQRDLSVSSNKIGDVRAATGDLAGALAAYRAGLLIRERLAASDPANLAWQRDLSISHERIGDALIGSGNAPGALEAYQAGLSIAQRLAGLDPDNSDWQRDLVVSHNKVGDVQSVLGNRDAALAAYRAGLAISEGLVAADPANGGWRRDLIVSHHKIAQAGADVVEHLTAALEIAIEMDRAGILPPADAHLPALLKDELAKAKGSGN